MDDNTYIIPAPGGDLIYAPLSGYLCRLSSFDSSIGIPSAIYEFSNIGEYPKRWGHLVVIPTQICNLNCSYCYAHQAHSGQIIDKGKLQIACDFLLAQDQEPHKSVSFIGGGEPLLAWDLIEWSIKYLEQHKKQEGTISFAITTNATLLNPQKIQFLRSHNVHIEVSFDILRDIQERQRPFLHTVSSSYDSVINSLNVLDEMDTLYSIRATITPNSIKRMPDMIQSLVHFNNIKFVKLEPVTSRDVCCKRFYDEYTEYFWQARLIGLNESINVTNSIIDSVENIKDIFCVGDFCVGASGHISACHRNTSHLDSQYDLCHIGDITDNVDVCPEKMARFLAFSKNTDQCKNCFARWHCAGFCPMEWLNLSADEAQIKCNFIRENIKRRLLEIYQYQAESEKPLKSRSN